MQMCERPCAHFTGREGIARSQISFSSDRAGGGVKELYMMDYDGHGQRRVTAHESLTLAPVWSPRNDVLAYISKNQSRKLKRAASKLRLVHPLYNEEVHLLAKQDIRALADLTGKKVAIGRQGSGTARPAWIGEACADEITKAILDFDPVSGVAIDATTKPPATIEWE